jgi:hypothetical protein
MRLWAGIVELAVVNVLGKLMVVIKYKTEEFNKFISCWFNNVDYRADNYVFFVYCELCFEFWRGRVDLCQLFNCAFIKQEVILLESLLYLLLVYVSGVSVKGKEIICG